MSPSKETGFFLGAIAIHGIFLIIAWKTPTAIYKFDEVPETQLVEIDLPKDVNKEDVHDPLDQRPTETGAVAMRPTETARRDARADQAPGAVEPNATSEPNNEPPPTAPPVNEYDPSPNANTWSMAGSGPDAVKVYALKDGMRDTGPPPPAPTTAPPAKKVDRDKANEILTADVIARNKKLGLNLPAAGTVSSAAKLAVRSSNVPNDSRAVLVVTLGPNGNVKSVRVANMNSGTSADWEAVAASVKASLAGQPLKMNGDYSKGAIITINIQSKMQMPSGNKEGDPLSLNLGKSGPGGTFDLGDIGAKPIRQVYASFDAVPVK